MIRKTTFAGLRNCRKLSNGTVDVIVTASLGPRILFYGFAGQENILGLCPASAKVTTELGDWRPVGGHRLWTAPEAIPRSYVPDDGPVEAEKLGARSICLTQAVEAPTGIQKQMVATLDARGTGLTIVHRVANAGLWEIEVAPWALTIMNGGGCVIIPQEPYISHDDYLLPARPMVLWHYTDLSDPRFTIGPKYLRLRTDEALAEPQKIGVANKQGWAAYHRGATLFVKQFGYDANAVYPDCGCNCETYTAASFIELESVGPVALLGRGEFVEYVEKWSLHGDVNIGTTEKSLHKALRPIVKKLGAL